MMSDGGAPSRYVKLTKEQAPVDEINPGELNQPIEVSHLAVHKCNECGQDLPENFEAPADEPWTTGIFGCTEDMSSFWQGLFCPSVLFGRVYENVSEEETSWTKACICHSIVVEGGLTAASIVACVPGIDPHTSFLIWEGLLFVWWMCGIYTGNVRQTLQRKYHLQFPILCGLPFFERTASQTAHLAAGRTGKHLFLVDNDDGNPPLLIQMATDSGDLKFISALHSFKRRVAYANVNFDSMVGWRTSSIRRPNELPKPNLLATDPNYPHIVYVEHGNVDHGSCQSTSAVVTEQNTDLEEEMIHGLSQLSWERVDVSFHNSKQRYVAHSTIQVSLIIGSATVATICATVALMVGTAYYYGDNPWKK